MATQHGKSGKTLVRSRSGLRVVDANECLRSPLLLREPTWIPDNECLACMSCSTKFDFLKRRHHCRRCGSCYCSKCCDTRVALPRMCFLDPVRHCKSCATLSEKESDFFTKHLKTLQTGAQFSLHVGNDSMQNNGNQAFCQLSKDHRCMTFDPPTELGDLDLTNILSLQLRTVSDGQGNHTTNGVLIKYKTGETSMQDVLLEIADVAKRRAAQSWMVALEKAYVLMCESLAD